MAGNGNTAVKERLDRAAKLHEAGRLAEASAIYAELADEVGNSAELHVMAGNAAFEQKDHERAARRFGKAAAIMPDNTQILHMLGTSLFLTGRLQEARTVLQQTVIKDPDFNAAWCTLGKVYTAQNQFEEAIKVFLKVINQDLSDAEAHSKLAFIFNEKKRFMMAGIFFDLFRHYYAGPPLANDEPDTFHDTFFLDPEKAYATAKQNNRIKQTVAISAPQLCYYQGEEFADAPRNLIRVPKSSLADYFYTSRLRRPTAVDFDPSGDIAHINRAISAVSTFEETFSELHRRANKKFELAKQQKPIFTTGEPLRVLIYASRITTVMQYSSRDLTKALQRQGCEVKFLIETNDLENIDQWHYFEEYANFVPHAVININHKNNAHLHPDTYNIIWWQDLMPEIGTIKPSDWRQRDLNISAYHTFDAPLFNSGADPLYRQDHCIDHEIFSAVTPRHKRKKIVFVGSSYRHQKDSHGETGEKIVALMLEKMAAGQDISDAFIHDLATSHGVTFDEIFYHLLPFVVRDTTVEWLCSIAKELEYEVEIYGRWWDQNPLVAPYFKGELPHGPEVARVYNEAKYAMASMHRTVNSQRLAEIAACGAIPVLLDERSYPGVGKPHWDDECLFFRTRDELRGCLDKEPASDPQIIAKSYYYDSFADKIIEYIKTGSYPDQPLEKVST